MEIMAPVTRSQTAILQDQGHRIDEGTGVDELERCAASFEEMKTRASIAKRFTKRCPRCGKLYLREKLPRSSKNHSVSDDSVSFSRELEGNLRTKTSVHQKIQYLIQEAKEISQAQEKVYQMCKTLEAMPKSNCHFCSKWRESSPFVCLARLVGTLNTASSSNVL